ncbi:MAG: hypothetical protein RL603_779, partial [Pseudomonadota bacterium]
MPNFPFTAIVGQEDLKTSVLLAVIDPAIGGVLVTGNRGTVGRVDDGKQYG